MIKDPKLLFIIDTIKDAYVKYGKLDKNSLVDKAAYDLVTSTDFNIEKYIISQILKQYPNDKILSEETNSNTIVEQCTWTIDPIDGTYNMANGIKMYGIQCAMYEDGKLELAAIYLPHFDEFYYAKSGAFVVQAIVFCQTGKYIKHQKDLLGVASADERKIIETFLTLKNGGAIDFSEMSEALLAFAQRWIAQSNY